MSEQSFGDFGSDILSDLESFYSVKDNVKDYLDNAPSKLVVHTSTIPFASGLDINPQGNTKELHHGNTREEHFCQRQNCMFAPVKKPRYPEVIHANCPCQATEDSSGKKKIPICFLEYLRDLSRPITPTEEGEPQKRKFSDRSVMFCTNGASIFGEKYPSEIRKQVNAKGWRDLDDSKIPEIMDQLYWYRRYSNKKELVRQKSSCGFLKTALRNIIANLDAMVIKLFYSFGAECYDYREIARRTARAFDQMLPEFLRKVGDSYEKQEDMVFRQIKPWLKRIKSLWHDSDLKVQITCLDYDDSSKIMEDFFGTAKRVLKDKIHNWWAVGINYLKTPAWAFRMAYLCETRAFSHFPEAIKKELEYEQFKSLVRPAEKPDPAIVKLIYASTQSEMEREKIPHNGFLEMSGNFDKIAENLREDPMFNSIIAKLAMDIPFTAEQSQTRSAGGKAEADRIILKEFREKNIMIPIRDLNTGAIKEYFDPPALNSSNPQKALFWIAIESAVIFLRSFRKAPYIKSKSEDSWPPEIIDSYFKTVLIAISEPLKLRFLIKGSSMLHHALAPMACVLAYFLAKGKSFRAGLLGSNQAWKFEKRCADAQGEASFAYDSLGNAKSILFGFLDWKEATDWIIKMYGLSNLRAQMDYIGFHKFYGDLCLRIMAEPQKVSYLDEVGWIKDGFMMGMLGTKNILHGLHLCEAALSREYLESLNKFEDPKIPEYQNFGLLHQQNLTEPIVQVTASLS